MSDWPESGDTAASGDRERRRNHGLWRLATRLTIGVAAVLAAVIAFLALRPSPYVEYLWWMPRRLGIWADHHGVSRNALAFFILALPVFLGIGQRFRHAAVLAVFAAGLEVAQLGIRGRIFDWRDIVASLAGIALAWPVAWIVRHAWKRNQI